MGAEDLVQMIKAREGRTNVAAPAYGYRLSEDRQHLEVNPVTASIYKFIVEKYLEGWGQLKIVKYLNSNNIHGSKIPSKTKEKSYYFSYVDQNRFGACDTKTKYWNMLKVDDLVMNEIRSSFKDKSLIVERIRN